MAEIHQPLEEQVEIDERWLEEWITYGLHQFDHLLARHAAFLAYCGRHDRSTNEEGEP